jgi:hypothetical protein
VKTQKVLINCLVLALSVIAAVVFCSGAILRNNAYSADPPLRPAAWPDDAGKATNAIGAIDTDLIL